MELLHQRAAASTRRGCTRGDEGGKPWKRASGADFEMTRLALVSAADQDIV